METTQIRPLVAGAIACAAAALPGCQSYDPDPLDLPRHAESWGERGAGDGLIREFAAGLSEPERGGVFDPTDGLTAAEGEVIALVFNPDLRLARLRAGVARAGAEHAGLWDDPEFAIDILRVTEGVPDPWVITPALSITIPVSGRLAAEKARADASARVELARVAEAEWEVRAAVREKWLRWSAAVLRAERGAELVASMGSLMGSIRALAATGEMARTEVTLIELERASRARAVLRDEGEAAEAEQRLRALMGLSPGAALELIPSVAGPTPEGLGVGAAPERNLTLARLRLEYEVAEATLLREIRKQYPDLTIGPQYESDQGQSKIGLLGAIPIPILNSNKRGIAEARAERELARAAFETEYERLGGAMAAARARHESLREQRRLHEREVVPLTDRQLSDARRLLELGEGDGLVLLESLSRAGETQAELIEVRLHESLAAVELDRLTGPAWATPSSENDGRESP